MKQPLINYSGGPVIKIQEGSYITWEPLLSITKRKSSRVKKESKKNNLKAANMLIYKLGT